MKPVSLYSYFRSSAAYRVRIAMNLKGVDYQQRPINLLQNEQQSDTYKTTNPQGLVPALETEQGILTQSLAILEWLEETCPEPSIMPGNSWQKARLRSLAFQICCDIHPINNLRVLKYLETESTMDKESRNNWYRHWIQLGFSALEQQLDEPLDEQRFCYSGQPSIADICLVPQVFNALRFEVEMTAYPRIWAIYQHCNSLQSFIDAAPENQPDVI